MKNISLPGASGKHKYPLSEVIRIESSSNYSKIFTSTCQHPIVVAKILSYFEEMLPGDLFARIHRSHLVNKKYIRTIEDCCIKGTRVILVTGEVINISRRKKSEFLKQWNGAISRALIRVA